MIGLNVLLLQYEARKFNVIYGREGGSIGILTVLENQ